MKFMRFLAIQLSMRTEKGGRHERLQSLESYLIMPIQRILRYRLLLNELLKRTHAAHPGHGALRRACALVDHGGRGPARRGARAADGGRGLRRLRLAIRVVDPHAPIGHRPAIEPVLAAEGVVELLVRHRRRRRRRRNVAAATSLSAAAAAAAAAATRQAVCSEPPRLETICNRCNRQWQNL